MNEDSLLWWCLLALLAMVVGGGYAAFSIAAKGVQMGTSALDDRRARKERARVWVEQRMIALFREFPDLASQNPGAIAQIVHDELVNGRIQDNDFLVWAVPATAERLWRTVLVEIERASRRA